MVVAHEKRNCTMRISDLGARALGVLGAIALLAGCGGSTGLNPLPNGEAPNVSQPDPLRAGPPPVAGGQALDKAKGDLALVNEVLLASKRQIIIARTRNAGRGGLSEGASFTAQGKALGSAEGTFTATGQWTYVFAHSEQWSFDENFTIASGGKKISGVIEGGGVCVAALDCTFETARALTYEVNGAFGEATAKIDAGDFNETLYGFVRNV
jgi:hypothetical protein